MCKITKFQLRNSWCSPSLKTCCKTRGTPKKNRYALFNYCYIGPFSRQTTHSSSLLKSSENCGGRKSVLGIKILSFSNVPRWIAFVVQLLNPCRWKGFEKELVCYAWSWRTKFKTSKYVVGYSISFRTSPTLLYSCRRLPMFRERQRGFEKHRTEWRGSH